MKKSLFMLLTATTLFCACQQPKPKRPTYGEIRQQRIDSMIREAQRDIPALDSELQAVGQEYRALEQQVEAHRRSLTVTEAELNRLAALRLHRDSLQVKFDTQCARVRFLHKKNQEQKTKQASHNKRTTN